MLNFFKHFARKSNLNPLCLYEMTICEIMLYLGELDEKLKDELELEVQLIRVGVANALSGKNQSLFKEREKPKVNRVSKEFIRDEIEALGEI